jgi:surface polysaccharide O-acyltransferase-like enzyme
MVNRNYAIDTIKAIACLFVVLIHVSAPLVISADETSLTWWSANVLQAFIFWPVPVFIMISGYFLLHDKSGESTAQFYRRRFVSVALPAMIWIGLYMLWGWQLKYYPSNWEHVWRMLLSGNIFDHLYFLVVIIGLYIFVPFLRKFTAHAEGRMILAFGVVYTLFWVADYVINRQLGQWGRNAANFPLWYLGYFIMGYGYRRLHEQGALQPWRYHMLGVILFVQVVYVWSKYREAAATLAPVPYYYANEYFSVFIFLIAALLFPFLLTSTWMARLGQTRAIQLIASASFGIYLIHVMFIDLFQRLFLNMHAPDTLSLSLLEGAAVFFVSLVAILIIQAMPGLCLLAGGANPGWRAWPVKKTVHT